MNKRSIQFDPENSIYRSRIFICSSHLEFIGSRKFINLDRFREKDSVRRVSRHFAFAQFSFLSWLWIIDARVDTTRLTVGSTLILSLSLSLPTPQYSPLLLIVPFPFYLHTWKLAPTPKSDFLCPPNITKLLVCDDFDGRSRFYTSPVQTNVLQLRRRMADFEAVWAETIRFLTLLVRVT